MSTISMFIMPKAVFLHVLYSFMVVKISVITIVHVHVYSIILHFAAE